jgi:hypothetical protein
MTITDGHADAMLARVRKLLAPAEDQLLSGVAIALGCRVVRRTRYPDGAKELSVHLFGHRSDLERVEILFTAERAAAGRAEGRFATQGTSTALVLADRSSAVEAARDARYPDLSSVSARSPATSPCPWRAQYPRRGTRAAWARSGSCGLAGAARTPARLDPAGERVQGAGRQGPGADGAGRDDRGLRHHGGVGAGAGRDLAGGADGEGAGDRVEAGHGVLL